MAGKTKKRLKAAAETIKEKGAEFNRSMQERADDRAADMATEAWKRQKQQGTKDVLYHKRLSSNQAYADGSPNAEKAIDNLEKELTAMDDDYTRYVSKAEKQEKEAAKKAAYRDEPGSASYYFNKIYHHRLMGACIEPLKNGVDASSIVECISTYAGMALLDKSFAEEVGGNVRHMLLPAVNKAADKTSPGSPVRAIRDKMLRDEYDGRIPFSPRSAAATEIGFARRAFNDMRQPGANPEKIMDQYREACSKLREQANADGISSDMIDQSKRVMVGKLMDRDVSYKQLFAETAYGLVEKGPGKDLPDGKGMKVWNGEFQTADGQPFTGDFTIRLPMEPAEHSKAQAAAFSKQYAQFDTMDRIVDYQASQQGMTDYALYTSMLVADTHGTDHPLSPGEAAQRVMDSSLDATLDWGKDHPDAAAEWMSKHMASEGMGYGRNHMGTESPGPATPAQGRRLPELPDGLQQDVDRQFGDSSGSMDFQ